MSKTPIEWADESWNPTTGCTKISPGCKNCYAAREWVRFSNNPKSVYYNRKFTDVATHPERLKQAVGWPEHLRVRQYPDKP